MVRTRGGRDTSKASTRAKSCTGEAAPAIKEQKEKGRKPRSQPPPAADVQADASSPDEASNSGGAERQVWRVKAMLILYTFLLLIGFVLSLASDLSRLVPALLKLSLTLQILATVFFVLVGKAGLR